MEKQTPAVDEFGNEPVPIQMIDPNLPLPPPSQGDAAGVEATDGTPMETEEINDETPAADKDAEETNVDPPAGVEDVTGDQQEAPQEGDGTPTQVPFADTDTPVDQTTEDAQDDEVLISALRRRKRPATRTTAGQQSTPGASSSRSRKKTRTTPAPARLSVDLAHDDRFYSISSKTFIHELHVRLFYPEEVFLAKPYKDIGFHDYLQDKFLFVWATGLKSYCPNLVYEFYANLHPEIMNPDSIWYGKIYVRGKLLDLSPNVLNELLEMPPNEEEGDQMELVPETDTDIAKHISAGRGTRFGRQSMTPTWFTMKFHCLYRLCGSNILPTTNTSQVSSSMGKLIFTIDQHFELINFGLFVLKRMIPFTKRDNPDKSKLPYPGLITYFLEKNGILPTSNDRVIKLKTHTPGVTLLNMHNDFKHGPPPTGDILAQEVKDGLVHHSQRLTDVIVQLTAEKRKVAALIAKCPSSFTQPDNAQTADSSDTEST